MFTKQHCGVLRHLIERVRLNRRRRETVFVCDFVKVPGTKSKRSKAVVPLTPEARDAINRQARRSELVFTTEDGNALCAHNTTRNVRRRASAGYCCAGRFLMPVFFAGAMVVFAISLVSPRLRHWVQSI